MPMYRIRVSLRSSPVLELWADYPNTLDAVISFLSLGLDIQSLSVSKAPIAAMTPTQTPPAPVATVKTAPRYTCDQLGYCQHQDLACTACTPFAPGVIVTDPAGMLPGDKSDRRSLVKYMLNSFGMVALTMLGAYALGYWVGSK